MARRPSRSPDADRVAEERVSKGNRASIATAVDEQSDADDEGQVDDLKVLSTSPRQSSDIFSTIARDGLNLRSGPSTDFPVIRSLPFGTRVHVLGREGRWGLIDQQGDGAADGFAHLGFLTRIVDNRVNWVGTLAEDDVRAFWAQRNPRHAKLYSSAGDPLVDAQLLHASALGAVRLEGINPNHRIEMYGPSSGFRTSGSTVNHGAQPGTGRGAAMDFVIFDLQTGRMLTNHPGANHQHQGAVGENAPFYQLFFNEVVKAGSQQYPSFAQKARFGGYFRDGANALDTMHIDMRGLIASTAGGSLKGGFTQNQMEKWDIPVNHPFN